MTIYSQHANRGKVQILATYQAPDGAVSSTVTSLGSADEAAPLVEALNRVSALATVPLSVFDMRGRRVRSYPVRHVGALTDPAARGELLSGAHGLWYEYVCLELHRALADLDAVLELVPEPVRVAVKAELEEEARLLRVAAADGEGTESAPEVGVERLWDFGSPFVLYDGGVRALSNEVRENMDDFEAAATDVGRAVAVADMRLLATAHVQCSDVGTHPEPGYLELGYEPFDESHHFLTVSAPQPGMDNPETWTIEFGRWEPNDPDGDEEGGATERGLLRCSLPTRPSVKSIVDLIHRLDREPRLFAEIAESAAIGSPIAGTEFVVTAVGDE